MPDATIDLIKFGISSAIAIFAIITILVALRSRLLKSLKISKDSIVIENESKSRTNNYYMNRRIDDLDSELKTRCRKITNDFRLKAMQALMDFPNICPVVRAAISSSLRIPLYNSIEENGFKRKFSRDFIDGYLGSLIEEINLDYTEFIHITSELCAKNFEIPDFTDLVPFFKDLLMKYWVSKIKECMIIICEKKISTYENYLTVFQDIQDLYMVRVIENCIKKNMTYIEGLS